MPCLLAILSLATPRLVIVLLVIFTDYIGRACADQVLVPFLAFLFMPLTLLAYCFTINTHGSVEGWWWALLALAGMIDLGLIGGAKRSRRRRVEVRNG
jgi:hypothetical protein